MGGNLIMGLFGPKQLPTTSYGYTPPPGAKATAWKCSPTGCGQTGEPGNVPRSWPFACPVCGKATDPLFAEPWAHEARGLELEHLIASGEDSSGYATYELRVWRYKDALGSGDAAAARSSLQDFWIHDSEVADLGPRPFNAHLLLLAALEGVDLAGATAHMTEWLSRCQVESPHVTQQDCKTAMQAVVELFDTPRSREQPGAAELRDRALELGAEAEDFLSNPTLAGLDRLRS